MEMTNAAAAAPNPAAFSPVAPRAEVARQVAEILFRLKVVRFVPNDPIRLTSGRLSPCYIDCRMLISFPEERAKIIGWMADQVRDCLGDQKDVAIAGGETAGIPYAAFVAAQLDQPMVYVRKKPKDFGRGKQIEGLLKANQPSVLIEDMATDAGSKINFIKAIRHGGGVIQDVFVVFFYNIFASALTTLSDNQFNLHYLCSWADLFNYAQENHLFPDDQLASVQRYLDSPDHWTA